MFWTFFSSKTEIVPFDCKQFSRIPLLSIHPTVQCANIDKPIKYLFTHWYHYYVVYLITCMVLQVIALRPRACVLLITGWKEYRLSTTDLSGQLDKMLGKGWGNLALVSHFILRGRAT